MANTYSQIYLHFVFTVKGRQSAIPKQHKEELHKYITGLVKKRSATLLAVHCMPDHVHLFVGFKPVLSIADFIKEIKVETNEFIQSKNWTPGKFAWQTGYGVFSYSKSQINPVIRYINNQEAHHRKQTFRDEYLNFLKKFEVPFDEKYLFNFFD